MARKQAKKRAVQRKYKLSVAGQLFKHLGLQMYSGAVPAISELISNAYDAMARNVCGLISLQDIQYSIRTR